MPPWGFLANHTCSENPSLAVSELFFAQKTLALRKRPGIIAIEHLFESKCRDLTPPPVYTSTFDPATARREL
jgi:hypothetical protein